MPKLAVLITGSSGGIGSSVAARFQEEGFKVIGVDVSASSASVTDHLSIDLAGLSSECELQKFKFKVEEVLGDDSLSAVVNCAAVQVISPIKNMKIDQLIHSLQVNCVSAFAVTKSVLDLLHRNRGVVINIGSIHSRLTKPNFLAYSTSKAALEALTRGLAVELGDSLRICGISPAAIETAMLRNGFFGHEEKLDRLADCHPTRRLGSPEEVGRLVYLLVNQDLPFLNGSIISMDGGIGAVLNDP